MGGLQMYLVNAAGFFRTVRVRFECFEDKSGVLQELSGYSRHMGD